MWQGRRKGLILTSRLGNIERLRLSKLAAVGLLSAEGLDAVGGAGGGDEVGELVLAVRCLDLVRNGHVYLAAGLVVDEDKLKGLGVGVDVVPLDGVGLGQIPLGVLLGRGELESCRYGAVSECLGCEA